MIMRTLRLLPALLPALLFSLSCSSKEPFIKELPFGGMKGNVSCATERWYSAEYRRGVPQPTEMLIYSWTAYDRSGYEFQSYSYSSSKKEGHLTIYAYKRGVLYRQVDSSLSVLDRKLVERKKGYEKYSGNFVGTDVVRDYELFYDNMCKTLSIDGRISWKQRYDSMGRLIQKDNYDEDGKSIESVLTYVYDGDNNVIREIEHNGREEVITTFTYDKYDSHGNWTQKYVWFDGEVGMICDRQIEYR